MLYVFQTSFQWWWPGLKPSLSSTYRPSFDVGDQGSTWLPRLQVIPSRDSLIQEKQIDLVVPPVRPKRDKFFYNQEKAKSKCFFLGKRKYDLKSLPVFFLKTSETFGRFVCVSFASDLWDLQSCRCFSLGKTSPICDSLRSTEMHWSTSNCYFCFHCRATLATKTHTSFQHNSDLKLKLPRQSNLHGHVNC